MLRFCREIHGNGRVGGAVDFDQSADGQQAQNQDQHSNFLRRQAVHSMNIPVFSGERNSQGFGLAI
jgi:hypothetical protein